MHDIQNGVQVQVWLQNKNSFWIRAADTPEGHGGGAGELLATPTCKQEVQRDSGPDVEDVTAAGRHQLKL